MELRISTLRRPRRHGRRSSRALPAALFFLLALGGCFPRSPGPRLEHFPRLAPSPGDRLPPVTVLDLDGAPVDLREQVGLRPVVLQLGSLSCPVFRYRRHGIEELVHELGDRVSFLVLYTREAHPVGSPSPYAAEEWDLLINRLAGVRVGDADTTEERRARAAEVRERLGLSPVVLVDPMGDPAWRSLGRAPSAAFVLDASGRIVARQVWVEPKGLRRILLSLLADPP